jgi:hypothetical protein
MTMGEILDHIARENEVLIERTTLLHIMSEDGGIKPGFAGSRDGPSPTALLQKVRDHLQYAFNFEPLMSEGEEEDDDIDADVLFERCQGMAVRDVFLGDFSDDDAGRRRPRRPRRRNVA